MFCSPVFPRLPWRSWLCPPASKSCFCGILPSAGFLNAGWFWCNPVLPSWSPMLSWSGLPWAASSSWLGVCRWPSQLILMVDHDRPRAPLPRSNSHQVSWPACLRGWTSRGEEIRGGVRGVGGNLGIWEIWGERKVQGDQSSLPNPGRRGCRGWPAGWEGGKCKRWSA